MGEAKRRRLHCAYCGAPATSSDHVPPRSLFALDRTNLITVPSCDAHNGKRSGLDERFREFVSLYVSDETATTAALWETMARGIRRNKKRQDEIRSGRTFLSELNRFAIPVDATVVQPVLEQITRGLYWHCYKERLPQEVTIDARLMKVGDWMLSDEIGSMARTSVADGQFLFLHQQVTPHPTISAWLYVFHRRMVGMAVTDPVLADQLTVPSSRS